MPALPVLTMVDAGGPADTTNKLRLLPRPVLATRLGLQDLATSLACLSPLDRLARIVSLRPGPATLTYLAHALPEREAVWWSCMCVLATAPADLPETDRTALAAAQDWVRRPEATSRQALLATIRAAGGSTPASHSARAALVARVDRPDSLRAASSVSEAVRAAAALSSAPASAVLDWFHTSALDIAGGGAGWIAGGRDRT